MKKKRNTKSGKSMGKSCFLTVLLLLLAAGLFTACGKDKKKNEDTPTVTATPAATATATPTSTVTPTPTPAREPEDYDPSKLYEKAEEVANVYRIPVDRYMGEKQFEDVYVSGNYVFVISHEFTETEQIDFTRPYCLLFHLGRPDLIRTLSVNEVGDEISNWDVYPDGTVVRTQDNEHLATVYDREFTEVRTISYSGKRVSGTEEAFLWTFERETSMLRAYPLNGTDSVKEYSLRSIDVDGVYAMFSVIDGVQYAHGYTPDAVPILIAVTTATGDARTVELNRDNPTYRDDCIFYSGENRWYMQPLNSSERMTTFSKNHPGEYLRAQSGSMVLTVQSDFCADSEETPMYEHETMYLYDLAQKKLRTCKLDSMLYADDVHNLIEFFVTAHGEVVFYEADRWGDHVYLWDYRLENSAPMEGYSAFDDSSADILIAECAVRMQDKFGVVPYYWEGPLETELFDYRMEPITDRITLLSMMERLEECFAMFPDGFWREIPGAEKDGVEIYVCKEFHRLQNYMIEDASAVVNISGPAVSMAICSKYDANLEQTFVHETMHMMEQRLGEYSAANDLGLLEYWFDELNTNKYPYLNSYTDGDGRNLEETGGTFRDDPDEAWFIDAYSRTFYKEDRARVLENLYVGNKYYFNSPHLRAKADYLCAVIRAAFPSVAACKEPVLWERPFGIVDPESYLEKIRSKDSE